MDGELKLSDFLGAPGRQNGGFLSLPSPRIFFPTDEGHSDRMLTKTVLRHTSPDLWEEDETAFALFSLSSLRQAIGILEEVPFWDQPDPGGLQDALDRLADAFGLLGSPDPDGEEEEECLDRCREVLALYRAWLLLCWDCDAFSVEEDTPGPGAAWTARALKRRATVNRSFAGHLLFLPWEGRGGVPFALAEDALEAAQLLIRLLIAGGREGIGSACVRSCLDPACRALFIASTGREKYCPRHRSAASRQRTFRMAHPPRTVPGRDTRNR